MKRAETVHKRFKDVKKKPSFSNLEPHFKQEVITIHGMTDEEMIAHAYSKLSDDIEKAGPSRLKDLIESAENYIESYKKLKKDGVTDEAVSLLLRGKIDEDAIASLEATVDHEWIIDDQIRISRVVIEDLKKRLARLEADAGKAAGKRVGKRVGKRAKSADVNGRDGALTGERSVRGEGVEEKTKKSAGGESGAAEAEYNDLIKKLPTLKTRFIRKKADELIKKNGITEAEAFVRVYHETEAKNEAYKLREAEVKRQLYEQSLNHKHGEKINIHGEIFVLDAKKLEGGTDTLGAYELPSSKELGGDSYEKSQRLIRNEDNISTEKLGIYNDWMNIKAYTADEYYRLGEMYEWAVYVYAPTQSAIERDIYEGMHRYGLTYRIAELIANQHHGTLLPQLKKRIMDFYGELEKRRIRVNKYTINRSGDILVQRPKSSTPSKKVLYGERSPFKRVTADKKQTGTAKKSAVLEQSAIPTSAQKLQADADAWGRTVEDFIGGKLSKTKPVTVLNNTPLVLTMFGADKDCRVITSYGILQKIHKSKHYLPAETLKQIPDKMADPVAVFESSTVDGRYVMMIDLTDENGATIVVPIEFSKSGNREYSATFVTSAYGRTQKGNALVPDNEWFIRHTKSGKLRYINNEKSRLWLKTRGLELPTAETTNGKKQIFTETDLVKLKSENEGYFQSPLRAPEAPYTDVLPRGLTRFDEDGRFATIELADFSDFSTAVHELNHVLAVETQRTALAEGASLHSRTLWKSMCDFVGAEDMSKPWTVAQHEKFAKASERFLLEGVAPAPHLQGVFERMRQWMAEVYADAEDAGLYIDDKGRELFGGMMRFTFEQADVAYRAKFGELVQRYEDGDIGTPTTELEASSERTPIRADGDASTGAAARIASEDTDGIDAHALLSDAESMLAEQNRNLDMTLARSERAEVRDAAESVRRETAEELEAILL